MKEDHNLEYINYNKVFNLLNKSDAVIYISKAIEKKYKGNIVNIKRQYMIYNGVEIPQNFKKEYDNNINILITGSINGRKGHKDAIDAIMQLVKYDGYDNIKLYIAGKGCCEDELKKYVEDNNMEEYIIFLGYVKDMENLRRKIDIELVCSKCEAFGRVTVEAMLSKNLVIASNTGGTVELVEDGFTGFLYQEGDVKSLKEKICIFLSNKELCDEVRKNAYKEAMKKFNIDRCAKEVYNVYKQLI